MELLRPALSGISDKKERTNMTKALLKAMATDSMSSILEASRSAAKDAGVKSSKSNYEKACQEAEAAYAGRNPHMKKED